MSRYDTDVCVIGAGSAGLSFAAGAVQMGARVVLAEAAAMGGDCLNAGCVPSKALLAAAKAAHARGGAVAADFAAARAHVAATIAAIAPHDSQERFEGLGVRVIRARARFLSPDVVEAGGERIRARRVILATGARPRVPPIPGLATLPFLTNETVFDLAGRPAHLVVLGGGPVGMELAQAHRRLGAAVTVIEAGAVLGREDAEAGALVAGALRAEGVTIREHVTAASVSGSAGAVAVTLSDGSRIEGSHLLLALGRVPNVEGLDLAAAGIEAGPVGIRVDARLRTTNRRVYAAGDVAGQGQFTHLAGYHAAVAIRPILFGLPARSRHDHIPRVIYTDPELAQIGLTEAEARAAHGSRIEVIRLPFAELDRARTDGVTDGFLKLMVKRGRPVGVTIAGPAAGELIGLWAMVLANRLGLKAVANTVLPYPTMGELNKRAASAYFAPKLFDNAVVKAVVRCVQRGLP